MEVCWEIEFYFQHVYNLHYNGFNTEGDQDTWDFLQRGLWDIAGNEDFKISSKVDRGKYLIKTESGRGFAGFKNFNDISMRVQSSNKSFSQVAVTKKWMKKL